MPTSRVGYKRNRFSCGSSQDSGPGYTCRGQTPVIKVTLGDVKDSELPETMRRAMARQAEA
jgi:hypothetical protein